jgi:type IV pilus assembly protein PilP
MRHAGNGLALLGLALLLGACHDAGTGELEQELATLRVDPGELVLAPVPPLPDYRAVDYRFADRRSPFQAALPERRLMSVGDADLAPDDARSPEPLEAYELEQLDLVGILTVGGTPSALIRAPGGKVHRLRVGDHMGSDFGRIVDIASATVKLVEIVPAGQGAWIERSTQLLLDG